MWHYGSVTQLACLTFGVQSTSVPGILAIAVKVSRWHHHSYVRRKIGQKVRNMAPIRSKFPTFSNFGLAVGSALGVTASPQGALAAPTAYSCSIIDTSGNAESISMSLDLSGDVPQVGFDTAGRASLTLPQSVSFTSKANDLFVWRSATDKGEHRLTISQFEKQYLEIQFTPLSGAKAQSGFVGYCRSSKSRPPHYLPSTQFWSLVDDGKFLGWTQLSTVIKFQCHLISSDINYKRSNPNLLLTPIDSLKGNMSISISDLALEGTYGNAMVAVEGDHRLITALYSISKGPENFGGALKLRGPIVWLYISPGKGALSTTHYQGICSK